MELLPAAEHPPGVPDPRPPVVVERDSAGKLATSEAARALGKRGGQVRAKSVRLARSLGVDNVVASPAFKKFQKQADQFRKYTCAELARESGGEIGAAASSMVATASLQLALSRFYLERFQTTGDAIDAKMSSDFGDKSARNLLCGREYAVRSAQTRPGINVLDAIRAEVENT